MTDIFQEVEEEVRRERYAQLWKLYGDYVIAGVSLLILAVAGYQVWRYYDHKAQLKASDEYAAALALMDSGHPDQAATAFAQLADTAPGGYAVVARLSNADALLANGKTADALKLYREIAAGDDPLLASVARLREAWAVVDTTPRLQMEALLAPMTEPTSPWRFLAREVLAYSDYKAGKYDLAKKEFETLAAETEAPIGVRQRANAMATFLKAGGDQNFGTVPPVATKSDAAPAAPTKPEAAKPNAAKPAKKSKAPHHSKGHAHR